MSGRMLYWLVVAITLHMCCEGLKFYAATWPTCPINGILRVEPGQANPKVTWLKLKYCNITSVTSSVLVYPRLERLDLTHNNIGLIENGSFDSLVLLKSVFLDNNRLLGKHLPSSLFRKSDELLRIKLSNNDMKDTPADLLQGLNKLEYLYCDNCSLHNIPSFITHEKLPIKSLSLSLNQLKRLDDPATFINISNLQSIGLEHNKIEYLHVDLLKPLTNLKYINLSSNKIRQVPEELFKNKFKLKIVNLEKNLIDYIPENVFLGNSLSTLNLSNNRLLYLSENVLSVLQKGDWGSPQLDFDGNLFPCACLNELLVKLKQLNIQYRSTSFNGKHKNCIMLDNFKCLGPDTYQELLIKLISEDR